MNEMSHGYQNAEVWGDQLLSVHCLCLAHLEGGVRRWVLLGVRMCSPFERAILRAWTGGLVAHPLGWGVKRAGSKNPREVGSPLG